LTPEQGKALQLWSTKALPVFKANCAMCHDGSMPDIGYLAGMTDVMIRDTAIAFVPTLVNLGAPQSSRVLTKGKHTGPALNTSQASDILAWITAERDARPPAMVIETTPFQPLLCTSGQPGSPTCPINTVDLTALGTAATFTFVAEALSNDLYATQLSFTAGVDGLYLEHPLLLSWPPAATMGTPDSIDRYFAATFNLAPDAKGVLGASATFSGFAPTNTLSIRFDAFEKKRP
jgi:hypothetical protein